MPIHYRPFHRFQLLFILVFAFSCQPKNQQIQDIDTALTFDLKDVEKYLVSQQPMIKVEKHIVLESTENSLIGSVDKLLVTKSDIYIMDRRNTSTLFKFKNNGEFSHTISRNGNGPGEYNYLQDFDVEDNGTVHILDSRIPKVIALSPEGDLLYETRFSFFAESFKYLGDGNYLFHKVTKDYERLEDMSYNLIMWNMEKGVIGKYLPDRELFDHRSFVNFSRPDISSNASNILYYLPFDYKFYELQNNQIIPKYAFDFGDKKATASFFGKGKTPREIIELVTKSDKAFAMSGYYETEFFFTTTFRVGQTTYLFLYDKHSEKVKIKKTLDIAAQELMVAIRPKYADEKFVYGVIPSHLLLGIKKSLIAEDKTVIEKAKKSNLEFVKDLPQETNPVIVKYSFLSN